MKIINRWERLKERGQSVKGAVARGVDKSGAGLNAKMTGTLTESIKLERT
jgi:hypothetical protein